MKVVILAGGKGTRISEETRIRPKPMVEIGGKPILWHIMKIYSYYGFNDFIICCGYKGRMIKEYFVNYYMYQSDNTFYFNPSGVECHNSKAEEWKVTLVDTGFETLTAGRILKVREYIGDEPFLLTYGDGVSNVNIPELIKFHREHGRISTITTVQPTGRFGGVAIDPVTQRILRFKEKARTDQVWVNAGFMVMNPEVFDYLGDGSDMLEGTPFEKLVQDEQMSAYRHEGFWMPMDNIRDREYLQGLWNTGEAPWKLWN